MDLRGRKPATAFCALKVQSECAKFGTDFNGLCFFFGFFFQLAHRYQERLELMAMKSICTNFTHWFVAAVAGQR